MSKVKSKLVELIIRMSRIRRCMTGSQCLHLANDLIAGTEVKKEGIKFKEKIYKEKVRDSFIRIKLLEMF